MFRRVAVSLSLYGGENLVRVGGKVFSTFFSLKIDHLRHCVGVQKVINV